MVHIFTYLKHVDMTALICLCEWPRWRQHRLLPVFKTSEVFWQFLNQKLWPTFSLKLYIFLSLSITNDCTFLKTGSINYRYQSLSSWSLQSSIIKSCVCNPLCNSNLPSVITRWLHTITTTIISLLLSVTCFQYSCNYLIIQRAGCKKVI